MDMQLLWVLVVSTLVGGVGGHGLLYISDRLADVITKDKPIYVDLKKFNS